MSNESASNNEPVSTRRLNSFPPPDLEVLVGPKQRIYRYHALILASYSTYVDTILSSPMAVQNQQERRVNFPDIPEETWEAMISYLEPGGFDRLNTAEKIQTVLPFYDKYQFTDGLAMCDSWISRLLDIKVIRDICTDAMYFPDCFAPIAVMAFDLNLPTAKLMAASWAAKVLKQMSPIEESTVKMLLPLVENNNKVLKTLSRTIKGRHYKDMTIDEMRKMTKEESFPGDIILKTKQIHEMEEIMKKLFINKLFVEVIGGDHGPDTTIGGLYKTSRGWHFNAALRNRGPMRFSYKMKNSEGDVIAIEAMDPFGLKWEISTSSQSHDDDEENQDNDDDDSSEEEDTTDAGQSTRAVLYRWDCGYSSIFPPQHGWKSIEGPRDIKRLSYQFSDSPI